MPTVKLILIALLAGAVIGSLPIAAILIFFFSLILILISNVFLRQRKVSNCAGKLWLVYDKVDMAILKAGLIATY